MNFVELKAGESVEGSDIVAYRSEKKGNKYVYLMAGVHGDEVEGVYLLDQLFDWIKKNDNLDYPFIIIPNLNVDGYRAVTRGNAHGVDLNRNFPTSTWKKDFKEKRYFPGNEPLSEPENKFLVKLFAKYPPQIIFSFHTWIPMVNSNGNCVELAKKISELNGYPLICEDIEGHPTPGSLGDYSKEVLGCPVLTLECPEFDDVKGLKEIWEENRAAMQYVLSTPTLFF